MSAPTPPDPTTSDPAGAPPAPRVAYDYALLRLVPDVGGETALTVGVVLHSRQARVLRVSTCLDDALATALAAHLRPGLDLALVRRYLDGLARVASGAADAGVIAALPPSERFHWLTAPRSTVVQPGPVRGGLAPAKDAGLAATFAALCRSVGVDGVR